MLISIFVLFYSCDNTVEPIDFDTDPYSVYGVLNIEEDPNYVRIRDLKAPFTSEATEDLGARVFLDNIDQGTSEELIDVRTEFEGVFQHNFEISDLMPDVQYILRIESFEGNNFELETRSPSKATTTITPAIRDCETPITVEFGNLNGGAIEFVLSTSVVEAVPEVDLNFFQAFFIRSDGILYADEENPNATLSYTFTPIDWDGQGSFRNDCSEFNPDRLVFTIIHFSQGLREKILPVEFDVFESTNRFGVFDIDTLEVTF